MTPPACRTKRGLFFSPLLLVETPPPSLGVVWPWAMNPSFSGASLTDGRFPVPTGMLPSSGRLVRSGNLGHFIPGPLFLCAGRLAVGDGPWPELAVPLRTRFPFFHPGHWTGFDFR